MSRHIPLDLPADIASCAGAALGLRGIARRIEHTDPALAETTRALAVALTDFADVLRDARSTAFRAERLAAQAHLTWRGRTVVAEQSSADPDAVDSVLHLVNRSATSVGKANAELRHGCADITADLRSEPGGPAPFPIDRSVSRSRPPRRAR